MGKKKKVKAGKGAVKAQAVPKAVTSNTGVTQMLDLVCTNAQKIKVTVAPESASGQPAPVDGALRLTVFSGDGTVEQDPTDPLSFYAISGASAGLSEFGVEVDARIGPEEVIIGDRVNLNVTLEEAVSLGLIAGAPEPK